MADKDTLTLTVRMHDPKEKQNAAKSTAWAVANVPREDLAMPIDEFIEKYMKPAFLADLDQFFKR